MKNFILSAIILLPAISSADIIKCFFTEPFVTSEFNTADSTLTYSDFEGNILQIGSVQFQIKGAAEFELVKDGQVLQHLDLNYQGSNGMSDHVYPYDVKDNHEMTHEGWGGCESDSLKSKLP